MVPASCVRRLLLSGVLVVAAAGCTQTVATGDLDKVQLEISRFDVTVTNTSGRTLLETRVEIVPVGRKTIYSVHVGSLQSAEKRSYAFNLFTDRDGVPFSPRTAKASAVAFSAKDIDGAPVSAEVPWQQ